MRTAEEIINFLETSDDPIFENWRPTEQNKCFIRKCVNGYIPMAHETKRTLEWISELIDEKEGEKI